MAWALATPVHQLPVCGRPPLYVTLPGLQPMAVPWRGCIVPVTPFVGYLVTPVFGSTYGALRSTGMPSTLYA